MKLTKNLIRSLILEQLDTVLQEMAAPEVISHLDDVLELPKSALPFQNIFGDKYRLLGSYYSDDPNAPFNLFEAFIKRTGWRFDPEDIGYLIRELKTSFIGKPQDGLQYRTKTLRLSVTKYFVELLKYIDNMPEVMRGYSTAITFRQKYLKEKFKHAGRGFKKEYLEDSNVLNVMRKEASLANSIQKFIPGDTQNIMRVFQSIRRVRWDEDDYTMSDLNAHFGVGKLKEKALAQQKWLVGEKGTGEKNYEKFTGTKYDEYKKTLQTVEYVVFSRHPIDVFRMSDHEGMASCHSLPYSDYKDHKEQYDQYNICALAEAHANGMIAYALNPDNFEDIDFVPTQEGLDKFDDEELFYDKDRGIEGLTPVSRLRIRNVAFLEDKRNQAGVISRIAVPEKRSYGDETPGFVEFVNKTMANIQKETINDILDKQTDSSGVDFRRFLRVGGSYEDNSIENTVPALFMAATGKELFYQNSVQYSKDLENSLRDQYAGATLENAVERVEALAQEYGNFNVSFEGVTAEEDWTNEGFFLTGQVIVRYAFTDDIQYSKSSDHTRDLISEAVDEADNIYFYDDAWFTDYDVGFEDRAAGYSNVMRIVFDISNFQGNDEYYPYDIDTWMYAFSDIADKFNSILDPHVDDSLNNYILAHISYHGEIDKIRTHMSSQWAFTKFQGVLEEDGNWDIEDVDEVEDENGLGLYRTAGFTVTKEVGASLGLLFGQITGVDWDKIDEENPKHVEAAQKIGGVVSTIVSMMQSDGMNIIKASLLDDSFMDSPENYETTSRISLINELDMQVTPTIGWGDAVSPERIIKAILKDEYLELEIKFYCDGDEWTSADIAIIGNMMLGKLNDNNGWHIDSDDVLEKMAKADLQAITQPKENISEFIKREIKLLLNKK